MLRHRAPDFPHKNLRGAQDRHPRRLLLSFDCHVPEAFALRRTGSKRDSPMKQVTSSLAGRSRKSAGWLDRRSAGFPAGLFADLLLAGGEIDLAQDVGIVCGAKTNFKNAMELGCGGYFDPSATDAGGTSTGLGLQIGRSRTDALRAFMFSVPAAVKLSALGSPQPVWKPNRSGSTPAFEYRFGLLSGRRTAAFSLFEAPSADAALAHLAPSRVRVRRARLVAEMRAAPDAEHPFLPALLQP